MEKPMHKLTREQHRILTAMDQYWDGGLKRGLWAERIGNQYARVFLRGHYLLNPGDDDEHEDVSVRMLRALRRLGLIELEPYYRPFGQIRHSMGLLDMFDEHYRVTDAGRDALKAWAE
jgi:hypothetical protein